MTRNTQRLFVLLMLVSAAFPQSAVSRELGKAVTFTASNGAVIKLDLRTGTFETPRSRGTALQDCSDTEQVCLTDHRGFAFAYFRKCNDAGLGEWARLRFPPKVVWVLHNSDVWLVFDAAPRYLFHYGYSKGIVGIYEGETPSFDFRTVLHDRTFQLGSLESKEYRVTSSETIAACAD